MFFWSHVVYSCSRQRRGHSVSHDYQFHYFLYIYTCIINTEKYCSGHVLKQRKFVDITLVFELSISKLREYGYHDKPNMIMVLVSVYLLCDDSGPMETENHSTNFRCCRKWLLQYLLIFVNPFPHNDAF